MMNSAKRIYIAGSGVAIVVLDQRRGREESRATRLNV